MNKGPEEKKRYMPIQYEELKQMGLSSPVPQSLQQMKIFEFDVREYPFREAIAELLHVSEDDLERLHTTEEGREALEEGKNNIYIDSIKHLLQEMSGSQHRKRGKQPLYLRRWTRSGQTGERDRFNKILDKFVSHFISCHMSPGHENRVSVAYQREPTFRVVLPSGQQLGYPHCDADYHHPPAEVNWWLPLTPVSHTNTLHTETLPGAGDFAPVNLHYGQVLRFYGNLCSHYTVPNISDSTRVSFDMRVLSLVHHDPEWRDRLGRRCLFRVGQYYKLPEDDA